MTNAIIQPRNQAKPPLAGAHQKSGCGERNLPETLVVGAILWLQNFVGKAQLNVLIDGLKGEESGFFCLKIMALAQIICDMPTTYETDGSPTKLCYLHYFTGNSDWYILEKDSETEQWQCFALCQVAGGEPEFGYCSIAEIIEAGAEIDLYFVPTALATVAKKLKGI